MKKTQSKKKHKSKNSNTPKSLSFLSNTSKKSSNSPKSLSFLSFQPCFKRSLSFLAKLVVKVSLFLFFPTLSKKSLLSFLSNLAVKKDPNLVVGRYEPEYVVVPEHRGLIHLDLSEPGLFVDAVEYFDGHVLAAPLAPLDLAEPCHQDSITEEMKKEKNPQD